MTALPMVLPARYLSKSQSLDGGQGVVHLYIDTYLDRLVAVKILHNVANYEALGKEIEARGKIKSKHVAEIYDCIRGPDGHPKAVILEYVPGDALFENHNHPNSLSAQHRLLYQLACGLSDIHAANVIHRDIKPNNMKVDIAGVLKIFDLGISNLDADNAFTIGGAGSLVFRAPELYGPPPIKVSAAADVYAFGVIAWWLYTKSYPSALQEVPPQSITKVVPSITAVLPNLGYLGSLIDRSLSLDPQSRPTAGQLKEALGSVLTHGRHRGIVTLNDIMHELSSRGSGTKVRFGIQTAVGIWYDGDIFTVSEVEGSVYINNIAAIVGAEVPHSCVITFGAPELGSRRAFVPFNVSHPEVVL
jgi:serine/threonine protein kinase